MKFVLLIHFFHLGHFLEIHFTVLSLDWLRSTKDMDDSIGKDLDQTLSQQVCLTVKEAKQATDVLIDSFWRLFRKLLEELRNVLDSNRLM